MSNVTTLTKQIKMIFKQSKSLSTEDYNKFLYNVELIKKYTTQHTKREQKPLNLFENKSSSKFIDYLKSGTKLTM